MYRVNKAIWWTKKLQDVPTYHSSVISTIIRVRPWLDRKSETDWHNEHHHEPGRKTYQEKDERTFVFTTKPDWFSRPVSACEPVGFLRSVEKCTGYCFIHLQWKLHSLSSFWLCNRLTCIERNNNTAKSQ